MALKRDPHCGPVPEAAWIADDAARARGRVAIFNAARADGLDGGWTMDERQYTLMHDHILRCLDELAGDDGSVPLSLVVSEAQRLFSMHEAFPKGRVRNYCTFTKVDMEARCEIERLPGVSPQRIVRWREE
jgi:hypothetical protein